MRILILWTSENRKIRQTIKDHVFSFRKYDQENEYFYFDTGTVDVRKEDYAWMQLAKLDAVLFHYTIMSMRSIPIFWKEFTDVMANILREQNCFKALLPQDDYTCTEAIWDFANAIKANKIYTVMRECDYSVMYPKLKLDNISVETVLTGYVEQQNYSESKLPHEKRPYDCVYRARKLPYVCGKHGQLKYEIAVLFNQKLADSGLSVDINNTKDTSNKRKSGAILGKKWFDFLASSRCTIGCLSGSSIVDFKGELSTKIAAYMKENPAASYEECKAVCFPDMKEILTGAVSPRIFEAALTKTTQILVGSDYQGVLIPDVDYIMLNEDFSNLDEVVEKIKDIEYCKKIADRCYEHVIVSGKYSYKVLVEHIVKDIAAIRIEGEYKEDKGLDNLLRKICRKRDSRIKLQWYKAWCRAKLYPVYLPIKNWIKRENHKT